MEKCTLIAYLNEFDRLRAFMTSIVIPYVLKYSTTSGGTTFVC